MSPELLTFWQAQGPWALLFVSLLLLYIKQSKQREEAVAEQNKRREETMIKQNEKREERLIAVMESLGESYDKLSDDVAVIKKVVERRATPRSGGNVQ